MSLVLANNQAIDDLIASNDRLEWIPHSQIKNVKSSQTDNVHYGIRERNSVYTGYEIKIMLLLLGSNEICTSTFVSEFARKYSLPTHKNINNVGQFRRYSTWLENRNDMIHGFTKYDDKFYMVADKRFYHCYSRYGFCSTCGILRCSPVWCICGHKELSDGWTSNNKKLDELIKKSQLQTNSANDAYLEWIPIDCMEKYCNRMWYGLPTSWAQFILLETTTDLYDDELCDAHPDILAKHAWITIGFTFDTRPNRKPGYYLLKEYNGFGLCLACTSRLCSREPAFCYHCKAPRPLDWTTGNKSLDTFIMESWSNVRTTDDSYIRWIEYSLLTNVQRMTSLRHRCTHIADWLEPETKDSTKVILKQVVDGRNAQSFDFYQLIKERPEILTPDNIWIIGITQAPSTKEYYLVFYNDLYEPLDRFIEIYNGEISNVRESRRHIQYMEYDDFDAIKEIGSGVHGTVYTAKCKDYLIGADMPEVVVLKRFKCFDQTPKLFISELRNHAKCASCDSFFEIYGVMQTAETEEPIIVMQYCDNYNLLSYLNQNINRLTWRMKLQLLKDIGYSLTIVHQEELVHCNLHGGNIGLHGGSELTAFICDLGFSRSVYSHESKSTIRSALPSIAPEVFHTGKFTVKSDIYSFGIIMYLIAAGEAPFQGRQFDADLIRDILGGLRPSMPDSAPETYKRLAERCCDADPDKRPDSRRLMYDVYDLDRSNASVWDTVYHVDVETLRKSVNILATGDLSSVIEET